MTQINVSDFRQNLPNYLNRVFAGEEFLIVKNKIPVAHLNPVKKKKMVVKKRRILPEAFGMWKNRKEWRGMSSIEIADMLREKVLKGNYGN